jgi:hypothetical protein
VGLREWGWHSDGGRLRRIVGVVHDGGACERGCVLLRYPRVPWYVENGEAMLDILCDAAARLEQAFGLAMPATTCYVVEPETAWALQGAQGIAYGQSIVVGVPQRQLSVLGGVGAHELAHVLSGQLGDYSPPFKGEGFACYAAWRVRADRMPMGLPLHFHLGWLLSVGVKPALDTLWERHDYSPELYDLAWSFAAFLIARFGMERYFDFYRSGRLCLRDRLEDSFGMTPAALERAWHERARCALGSMVNHSGLL